MTGPLLRPYLCLAALLALSLSTAGLGGAAADAAPLADTQAPSVPQGQALVKRTRTSVTMVWRASTDNVAVAGYRLFRNGRAVATVRKPGFVYRGLRCGTRYTLALEAYDAAGNASNRAYATGSISTVACAAPRTKPKPAEAAPKAPQPAPAVGRSTDQSPTCGSTPAADRASDEARGPPGSTRRHARGARHTKPARTGDLVLVRGWQLRRRDARARTDLRSQLQA